MQINIIEGKKERKRLRVCAYCRVSTDADEQENSLENQIKHYKDAIQSNPEYEYVGVYSDFAISGFKEQRPGFQRMMDDARQGKIDLILTKSVSRFARNTAIVLKATRELKEKNIGVFFELQNINTLSGEGELMLSIIAAFAQAESESGSAGAKMVYQRKYEAGIPVQFLERSFGYIKDTSGEYVPKADEAAWVKKVYEMASEGYTPAAIKRILNENNVPGAKGSKWSDCMVTRMIENEIYKGDFTMQKTYINDERKQVKNRGEKNAWYIEDDHPAIVSRELWQKAQDAMKRKREYRATGSYIADMNDENYPYRNRLFCSECGFPLYPRIYSNGNRLNWGCSGRVRYGTSFCKGINVPDGTIRNWNFDEDIYIRQDSAEKGFKEFSFIKEASWKRRHKRKKYVPQAPKTTNEVDYPYHKHLHCAICGYRLTRVVDKKNNKVTWVCSGNKHYGKDFCSGVRVRDAIIKSWGDITSAIFIEGKVKRNGEKSYSYSGKKPDRSQTTGTAGRQT